MPPLCENLTEPPLAPAIHIGNSCDLNGGFAEALLAHRSQMLPIPDHVTDVQAMLSDTVSVALAPLVRHPPDLDRPVLVYGMGSIGLCLVGAARRLYPGATLWAVARHPHQARMAEALGADRVLPSAPRELIAAVSSLERGPVRRPWLGLPWLERGAGTVYDTIASAETVETSLRVADKRATLVHLGVSTPRRFEWSLLYFKEVTVTGSNAFGRLEWRGEPMHAYDLYWRLVREGLDLSPLVTHTFGLGDWGRAMITAKQRRRSGAIKVAIRIG
jgi:threonine dehydrogenase-like Zn-dependent dehydrogenase